MDIKTKKKKIQDIIDSEVKNFANSFKNKHLSNFSSSKGIINQKKNNVFIAALGKKFMFYSALIRSFDSSFGNVLENIGNKIAALSFIVDKSIDSFLTHEQMSRIDLILNDCDKHEPPSIDDYSTFSAKISANATTYKFKYETDHCLYNEEDKTYYIIELKAGGDLDNKKAKAEKSELLKEYFLLKNKLLKKDPKSEPQIKIYLATAYNKFGEGNLWNQKQVKQYFADDELLIGKDYWNFICGLPDGFNVVLEQYEKSKKHIENALEKIKTTYF